MHSGVTTFPLADGPAFSPLGRGEPSRSAARLRDYWIGPENRVLEGLNERFERRWSAPLDDEPLELSLDLVLLVGPSGSGKTRLVHVLARLLDRLQPTAQAVMLPLNDLARDYHQALTAQTLDNWRESLCSVELLVLDDLSLLAEKRGTQIELAHLLDLRGEVRRPTLILTRDGADGWNEFVPGLQSRLSAGLLLEIQPPSVTTRRAALERLAGDRGMSVTPVVLDALAEGCGGTLNEVCGALVTLDTTAQLRGGTLEPADVRRYLDEQRRLQSPSLRDIAVAAARQAGITLRELRGPSRRQAVVGPRNTAIYLARQLTGMSYEQIGRYFGGRDHTTILHGCRQVERRATDDPWTRQTLLELRRLLRVS